MSARAAAGPSLKVVIRGLIAEARIGVGAEERAAPQRLRLDLELAVAPPADLGPDFSDDIAAVYDYGALRARLHELCRGSAAKLLETLAERIARDCLSDPRVLRARVRIEKPDIFPDCDGIGVEIELPSPSR
ncbi:MAG: dihydroneopterin aldolase [Rhodovibrionaceae bacterium]